MRIRTHTLGMDTAAGTGGAVDVSGQALRRQVENHVFEFVTVNLFPGFKAGRRCRKCRQWAMGDGIDQRADEVCPKAVERWVTEWQPIAAASGPKEDDRG